MATTGVYLIRNKTNGKVYVGSAINMTKRWNEHLCRLRGKTHETSKLQRAWNKYGEDNFEFIHFQECSKEDVIAWEQAALDFYGGPTATYNTRPDAASNYGMKFNIKHNKQIKKGQRLSPATEFKPGHKPQKPFTSEFLRGNKYATAPHSPERKAAEKISAKKGWQNRTPEMRARTIDAIRKYWKERRESRVSQVS